jgi:hypothetical protein
VLYFYKIYLQTVICVVAALAIIFDFLGRGK